jgi:glutathione synthase/RimK-type ligase-like ATP-grasp enzyme
MKIPQLRIVRVRTKNPSASPLCRAIFVPFKALCRLGSRTPTQLIYPRGERVVECNTVESIENSRDKIRMKECFTQFKIPQANWYHGRLVPSEIKNILGNDCVLVGKAICGFQGNGMVLIENDTQLAEFCRTHSPEHFFIEKFHNYGREYRLHATRDGVFLSWRKLRTSEATQRWFFNSHNCNWVGEDHSLFNKPSSWDELCRVACKAVESVGLDIGAVDIRISSKDTSQFIVCEVNSAPSLAEIGIEAYKEQIKKVLITKYNSNE